MNNCEEKTPANVEEAAQKVVLNLLPSKSREIYECAYQRFINWCQEKNVKPHGETVLLAYFYDLGKKLKPSSLWSQYSMVKTTLNVKHGIEIEKFAKLRTFLKRNGDGYIPKKSRVLTSEQIQCFLRDAPDATYLLMKTITIFGISGACRSQELVQLKLQDIEEIGSGLLVNIPTSKNKKPRSFRIMGKEYLNIYRRYSALRPKNFEECRFFVKYKDGRCQRQVVGIHKISSVPQEIAKYLNLENANEFSGHCFRRTSATLLVDSGGDITSLKRHGGWRSDTVAEGYIEESLRHKEDVARKILRLKEINTGKPETITHEESKKEITNAKNEVNIDTDDTDFSKLTSEPVSDEQTKGIFSHVVKNDTKTVNSDGRSLFNFYQSCSNCTFNVTFK